MKPKKILRYVIILAVVLIILAVVGKKVGWFGKEEVIQVAVEKAELRKIVETITANGKIQPETEVKISPEVSGEIVELNVVEGEYVKQGKLLVRIKPDLYISARDRALATMNSSKARLAQAQAQFINRELSYNRNKTLWEEKAISESEYETSLANYQTSKAELEAAKYSVKSSEASLNEAKENLVKTSIYAPMSGTISSLVVEKGERVVGTAMMTGTEMMRVSDLTRIEVKVEVNENDIVRVNLSDTANIEVDAYLGETFKGVVTEIANAANTQGLATDQVTNFDVKVFLLQSSYEHLVEQGHKNPFLPGMSATVDIETDTRYDVLTIPIQAVTTRADSIFRELADSLNVSTDENKDKDDIREAVFLVDDEGKAIMREVKTGIQDNTYIQILEGLELDDEVITAPYSAISKKLKHGSSVEVVDKEELFKPKNKKDRS